MTIVTTATQAEPRAAFDRISLRRLVLIRSVAVTGQAVTLLTVHFLFGFSLPLLPALAVVGCSVLLNLGSLLYHRAGARLGERAATLYLAYDTLQLAVLLYLTGGLENPFSILMLAPVTVAATGDRPRIVGIARDQCAGDLARAAAMAHDAFCLSIRSGARHLGSLGDR